MKESLFALAVLLSSASVTAKADVEVQCQMGSSCIYKKLLSRTLLKRHGSITVVNARIRGCF
jgi:hypothetical protein